MAYTVIGTKSGMSPWKPVAECRELTALRPRSLSASQIEIPIELITALRQARRVTVLTGAGISAESGIPTFRQAQTGLWSHYNPEELATFQAFQTNPKLVWEWYAWRRELTTRAEPNPAHLALVDMENQIPGFGLITQNVDGLHRRAGSGRRAPLIELHGNIDRTKCSVENRLIKTWKESEETPPRCPHCGAWLRPDVVWFGESLPREALQLARAAAQNCDVFFSIGTSGLVEPAASLPHLALKNEAMVVEINSDETPLTQVASYVFQGPAGVILPAIVRSVWEA